MSNWYAHRNQLKRALGSPATSTADRDLYSAVLESVSRSIDDYLGFHLFPSSGIRYYTPRETDRLYLDAPLLNVDSIRTSSDGETTFGSTMTSDAYYLLPYNATEQSPKQPWWEINVRDNTTASGAVFPTGISRSVQITGTWGMFDERTVSTAAVATAINATQKTIEINNVTGFHAGMTIRIDSEQMFIESVPRTNGSDTATSASTIIVQRAVNGSTGATHSSNSTIETYSYPIVDQACLYQSAQDYRSKDSPLGLSGAELLGGAVVKVTQGGLHPFTQRMLATFRVPVAI